MSLGGTASGFTPAAFASLYRADDRADQNNDIQDDRNEQDTGKTKLPWSQIGEQLTENAGSGTFCVCTVHCGFGMGRF